MRRKLCAFILCLSLFSFASSVHAEALVELSKKSLELVKNEQVNFELITRVEGIKEGTMTIVTSSRFITLISVNLDPSFTVNNEGSVTTFKSKQALKKGTKIGTVTIKALSTAPKETEAFITFSKMDFKKQNDVQLHSDNVVLKASVVEEKRKSSDNSLKSLSSPNVDISFTKETLEYSFKVKNEIKNLDLKAEATDPNAKVTIDNQNLSEGDNTISITVMAENGDEKVYKIFASREEGKQEKVSIKNHDQKRIFVLLFSCIVVIIDAIYMQRKKR